MFHSSTSFSMDLRCPLLRGSSIRRLRRRAATVEVQTVDSDLEGRIRRYSPRDDELDYQDNFLLVTILSSLANQNSNSVAKKNRFHDT